MEESQLIKLIEEKLDNLYKTIQPYVLSIDPITISTTFLLWGEALLYQGLDRKLLSIDTITSIRQRVQSTTVINAGEINLKKTSFVYPQYYIDWMKGFYQNAE